jgi:CheY-like chemotaxis protein
MDGPTATKEIRKLGYQGAIFGVTGNGLESDVTHFKNSGANHVLIKPLNYSDFLEAMSVYMDA